MSRKIHVSKTAIITDVASTKRYLQEIKTTATISREEEKELIKSAQAGDRNALNELITHNLRFVVQVARKYQGMGVSLEDLIGFGNIGLIEAVNRFDVTKDVKFITFAVWYVRSELQKALNEHGRLIRLPAHRTQTEKIDTMSIHTPVTDGDDAEPFVDRMLEADSDRDDLIDMKADIERALMSLPEKERQALKLHYGIGELYEKSMEQIADIMNITGERARQLVRSAELNLRNNPKAQRLLCKYF